MLSKEEVDKLSYKIIGAAIEVHRALGPGLLENVYHECMKQELLHQDILFETQRKIPLCYRNKTLDVYFRCDLLIEKTIVVELKSVKEVSSMFDAQVLTYMKLLGVPKGGLINFNCSNIFKHGQRTFVNDYYRELA